MAWEAWWEATDIMRILVQNKAKWQARFTAGLTSLLTVAERLSLPGVRVTWVTGDATLERCGAVDWSNKLMMEEQTAGYFAPLQKMLQDSADASLEAEDEEEN